MIVMMMTGIAENAKENVEEKENVSASVKENQTVVVTMTEEVSSQALAGMTTVCVRTNRHR